MKNTLMNINLLLKDGKKTLYRAFDMCLCVHVAFLSQVNLLIIGDVSVPTAKSPETQFFPDTEFPLLQIRAGGNNRPDYSQSQKRPLKRRILVDQKEVYVQTCTDALSEESHPGRPGSIAIWCQSYRRGKNLPMSPWGEQVWIQNAADAFWSHTCSPTN